MTNHFDSKGREQKNKRLRLCAVLALLLNCCQADGEKAMENERPSSLALAAYAKGDYGTALKHIEQSLVISREIGDKEGEAKTLNNIGHIHFIKVEKDKALSVFEQSLRIMQGAKNLLPNLVDAQNRAKDFSPLRLLLLQNGACENGII